MIYNGPYGKYNSPSVGALMNALVDQGFSTLAVDNMAFKYDPFNQICNKRGFVIGKFIHLDGKYYFQFDEEHKVRGSYWEYDSGKREFNLKSSLMYNFEKEIFQVNPIEFSFYQAKDGVDQLHVFAEDVIGMCKNFSHFSKVEVNLEDCTLIISFAKNTPAHVAEKFVETLNMYKCTKERC